MITQCHRFADYGAIMNWVGGQRARVKDNTKGKKKSDFFNRFKKPGSDSMGQNHTESFFPENKDTSKSMDVSFFNIAQRNAAKSTHGKPV